MGDSSFNAKYLAAFEEKKNWYNTVQLPKIQDNYRLHLVCVNNLFDALVKKSLINPDPYKKDKKISQIVSPEDTSFNENERANVLGIRFSDYQSMVDFICNYMKFTVDQLTMDKIKRLLDLNATFGWTNLSPNSPKINTRSMAFCINAARNGAQPIQIAMINDSMNKTVEAINFINNGLRELADFQKSAYKAAVRSSILAREDFDWSKTTAEAPMLAEIKRLYPGNMPKHSFNAELVHEIIEEEASDSRSVLQEQELARFKIVAAPKKEKEKKTVDTHEVIMEIVRLLGTSGEQYQVVVEKLANNNSILQAQKNTGMMKFIRFWRKLFNLAEPEVEYNIVITDSATQQSKKERLNYTEFFNNLVKRAKYYSAIVSPQSGVFGKISAQTNDKILDFLNKQTTENTRLMQVLSALDDYFKANVSQLERSKIKGIKPELSFVKSIMVKINQSKAECIALIEENEQMKKLGIAK